MLPRVALGVMFLLKDNSSRYHEPAEDGSTAFPLLCSLLVTVVLVPASTLAASLDWERIEKLKSIGFTLEKSDSWEEKYQLAKKYFEEHGSLRMSGKTVVNGVWLWKWLNEQKNIGLGKRKNKCLSVEQRVKLESIGMSFDHG